MKEGTVLALALFVAAAANTAVSTTLPGFRTAMTAKGFEYVRSIGIPILEKQLSDMTIPDQSGRAGSPVGRIDYSVSSIKGGALTIPTSSITLAEGSGITIATSGASLAVSSHWHYRMKSWPHISDSGRCNIRVSGVSLIFSVKLGMNSLGHITASAGSCHADIGNMDIKFHGGASWLYNLFSGSIARSLKGSLKDQACRQGRDAINGQANAALEGLPVTVNVDKTSLINYALTAAPSYATTYLETQHKGEFFMRADPTSEAPFSPNALPAISSPANMMYVWLTEYMANTAGYVYCKSNTLHNLITPDMVPASVRDKFSLNTESLQFFLPKLYAKYPNRPMTLFLNNSEPIKVSMTPGFITGVIPGTVQVDVIDTDNTSMNAFVLHAMVHFNATAAINATGGKTLLVGKAYYISTKFSLLSSNIGPFPVTGLEAAMNALSSLGVIPQLNKAAAAGFPLPVVDGVEFTHPHVQIGSGHIAVATDFKYTPSSEGNSAQRHHPQHVQVVV